MPGTRARTMSALRVFGAVVFERDGATWNYDTQRGGMIVLEDEGVLMPCLRRSTALVPWSAIRELRCWAPVPGSLRSEARR
jgi:hypothetical protein